MHQLVAVGRDGLGFIAEQREGHEACRLVGFDDESTVLVGDGREVGTREGDGHIAQRFAARGIGHGATYDVAEAVSLAESHRACQQTDHGKDSDKGFHGIWFLFRNITKKRKIGIFVLKEMKILLVPDSFKGCLTARQQFMGVALMPHVKYQFVPTEIKRPMQGDGQFDGPQIGGQMPAVARDGLDDPLAQLRRQGVQFLPRHGADILRGANIV